MKAIYSKYMEVSWAQRFSAGLGRYLPNLFACKKNHPENERNELAHIKQWKIA